MPESAVRARGPALASRAKGPNLSFSVGVAAPVNRVAIGNIVFRRRRWVIVDSHRALVDSQIHREGETKACDPLAVVSPSSVYAL